MTERLDIHETNQLLTGGKQWNGAGDAQAPPSGGNGALMEAHRTGCRDCGWKSEWRATKELARGDAKIHVTECPGSPDG